MRKNGFTTSIAICCLAAIPASVAWAAPTYTGRTGVSFASPTTGLVGHNDGGTSATPAGYIVAELGNQATALTLATNGGSAAATATSTDSNSTNSLGLANALASISYVVTIVALPGAPINARIPIRFMADGYADEANLSGGSDAYLSVFSQATYAIHANGSIPLINQQVEGVVGGPRVELGVNEVFSFAPTDSFTVDMSVIADAGGVDSPAGYAEAFVDPTFTIDPAFAQFFQLVGIPGDVPVTPSPPPVSSPSPIPEPPIDALLLSGVIAFARKRRRHGSLPPRGQ